jgi:hypothetical protein
VCARHLGSVYFSTKGMPLFQEIINENTENIDRSLAWNVANRTKIVFFLATIVCGPHLFHKSPRTTSKKVSF